MKHGMRYTRIYNIYHSLKYRCTNSKHPYYKDYGARGIQCTWQTFIEFYEDMKDGYQDNLTIDRRDNDGHYCKSNCRWITNAKQQTNRTNNRNYKGKCVAEWSRLTGIKENTIRARLNRGRTYKKAIT